jgi:hypothetical protein
MNVSNIGAYRNLSVFASLRANSLSRSGASGAAPSSSVLDASTGTSSPQPSGSYDFTSMTSRDLTKTANDLFNTGRLTEPELHAVLRLTLPFPRLENGVLVATPESPTQHHNYLEEARQRLAVDKANSGYAVPGQIEALQSLLDKFTSLQGVPKGGVDKSA